MAASGTHSRLMFKQPAGEACTETDRSRSPEMAASGPDTDSDKLEHDLCDDMDRIFSCAGDQVLCILSASE